MGAVFGGGRELSSGKVRSQSSSSSSSNRVPVIDYENEDDDEDERGLTRAKANNSHTAY
jgi:hypothetical protein